MGIEVPSPLPDSIDSWAISSHRVTVSVSNMIMSGSSQAVSGEMLVHLVALVAGKRRWQMANALHTVDMPGSGSPSQETLSIATAMSTF